ncbi:MAG TPA: hypothetical protein VMF06_20010 [Candidatus Limnocylindria bacterium]|nr:hypothetical protein [Candidatus Limnocylindria bacterium]
MGLSTTRTGIKLGLSSFPDSTQWCKAIHDTSISRANAFFDAPDSLKAFTTAAISDLVYLRLHPFTLSMAPEFTTQMARNLLPS